MSTFTPAELVDRLDSLGVNRTERTLRSWRQKGLLPALRMRSQGREGVRREWDDTILDQALATHCLLEGYSKADEALLSLWFCGFDVDHQAAQQAWIRHLERIRDRRSSDADRFREGRFGLARSLWRKKAASESVKFVNQESFEAIIDWLYDPNREDPSDSTIFAEPLSAIFGRTESGLPNKDSYQAAETAWQLFSPSELFGPQASLSFVQSLYDSELRAVHETSRAIWEMLKCGMELQDGSENYELLIHSNAQLMQSISPLVAKLLIYQRRNYPALPVSETISALHEFVIRIGPNDLSWEGEGSWQVSPQLKIRWEPVKHKLQHLWARAMET